MVDDEAHVGQSLRRGQRRRQLARADEKVIGQSSIPHRRQTALHVGPQQPLRIRLVMDLMADADERLSVGLGLQLGKRVADGGIGEVDPADDTRDEARSPRRSP